MESLANKLSTTFGIKSRADMERVMKGVDATDIACLADAVDSSNLRGHGNALVPILLNYKQLTDDPFRKTLMPRESIDTLWATRSLLKVARRAEAQTTATDPHDFFLWVVFSKYTDQIYLPRQQIDALAQSVGVTDVTKLDTFLIKHWRAETHVTHVDLDRKQRNIHAFVNACRALSVPLQNVCGDGLDEMQRAVVHGIVNRPFSILQGVAGTGKTQCMRNLVKTVVAANSDLIVACLALTHRAKNNIVARLRQDGTSSNPNVVTATIASFICTAKALSKKGLFRGRHVLIIDEASMVDLDLLGELAAPLTSAPLAHVQLALVGDQYQLQPVGRGECFRVAIAHARATGSGFYELTHCYRTEFLDLYEVQQSIRNGFLPESRGDTYEWIRAETDAEINSIVGRHIRQHDPENTQYIAWRNADVFKINMWVQARVHGSSGAQQGRRFLKGDRVIYEGENNRQPGLTNAMIGKVIGVLPVLQIAWQDGVVRTAPRGNDISLAYCITAHKAQGSEYPHVCVPCYAASSQAAMMDRRWLYTAATRSKSKLTIIGPTSLERLVGKAIDRVKLNGMSFALRTDAVAGKL